MAVPRGPASQRLTATSNLPARAAPGILAPEPEGGYEMMATLNQTELQSVRHLLGQELLGAAKAQQFAQQCQDQELKNQLQQIAQHHQSRAQKIFQLLQG